MQFKKWKIIYGPTRISKKHFVSRKNKRLKGINANNLIPNVENEWSE